TTGMLSNILLSNFAANNADIFRTQQQLSTGRRILNASMDAGGSTTFLSNQSRTVRSGGYLNTITDLTGSYNLVDSQVSEAVDIVNQLKQIALSQSNEGTSDSDTRALSATEVNNLRQALLTMANTRYNGMSLFGGKNTKSDAFSAMGDAIRFNGTRDVNKRFIDDGLAFDASMSAETLFGELQAESATRRDLNAALDLGVVSPPGQPEVSTPLSALNGGKGVSLGIVSVYVYPDGAANPASGLSYQVDLRQAKTVADVAQAFNNVTGSDGAQVFDVDVYDGAGTTFPQDGSNRIAGLKVTAAGEVATAIAGKLSDIQFVSQPGKSTAEDLGLITGEITYQTTSASLIPAFGTNQGDTAVAGTFTQTYDFDLKVNGETMAISVTPAGAQDLDDFAAELQTAIDTALNTAGLYEFSVTVSTDAVNNPDQLIFDITDESGTGSFELVASAGANIATAEFEDAFAGGTLTSDIAFNKAAGSFSGGFFSGRDLDPALSLNTSLATLNGGEGLTLAEADSGGVPVTVQPQGIRITNGALSADIDLSGILNDPTKTVGDLINRINNSGVQVEARIADSGDRIEIRSKLTGVPLKIENLNGTIASQLGIDSRFQEMRLTELNDGRGIALTDGADFRATTSSGVAIEFDVGEPETVQELVDAINSNSDNVDPATGTAAFTAKAIVERKFETTTFNAANLNAAHSFQVSLNGGPVRTISINTAAAALTMDQMAGEFETALQDLATEQGLSGMTIRVNADNGSGRLQFEVEDEDGAADIDFIGASTANFGLDGAMNAQGVRTLTNETVTHRFTMTDNTFDSANFQPGDPLPVLQNLDASSVLDDMGIVTSDAIRRQFIGDDVSTTLTFPVPATTFFVDLPRGQQITVNLAGETTMQQVADTIQTTIRNAITAQPIEGMRVSVRIDPASGGLMFETFDAYSDGDLTLSAAGTELTDLGIDSTMLDDQGAASYVFNFDSSSFEGTGHALRGKSASNIFTAVNDLVAALTGDNPSGVANTISMIENSLNRFLDAQSDAGSKVRRLDLATNRLESEQFNLAQVNDRVMNVDLAQAAVMLQRQETTLQASLQVIGRILSNTVLDYL
ncbi:MAG: hypothetical protein L6Q71_05135, partial [Planctomycetes bacterium]|nr:hypothetical protein [Planctomycetota bacterium]